MGAGRGWLRCFFDGREKRFAKVRSVTQRRCVAPADAEALTLSRPVPSRFSPVIDNGALYARRDVDAVRYETRNEGGTTASEGQV